jgi:ribosomal protein S18 acetylase RimI-like enzyme
MAVGDNNEVALRFRERSPMTNGITHRSTSWELADDAAGFPTAGVGTIPLVASDDDMAAKLLAGAFHTDPMMIYLAPDEPSRDRRTQPFFAGCFRYCRRYGIAELTETRDAAALWLKPGFTTLTMGRMLRTGTVFAPRSLGFSGISRFNILASYGDKLHKQAISGDHWYLLTIGVEAHRQRTGVGSRMLSAGLQRADADGLPCYLETANPDNLPFYRRHGFEVVADGQVPKGGLHVWSMVRR